MRHQKSDGNGEHARLRITVSGEEMLRFPLKFAGNLSQAYTKTPEVALPLVFLVCGPIELQLWIVFLGQCRTNRTFEFTHDRGKVGDLAPCSFIEEFLKVLRALGHACVEGLKQRR